MDPAETGDEGPGETIPKLDTGRFAAGLGGRVQRQFGLDYGALFRHGHGAYRETRELAAVAYLVQAAASQPCKRGFGCRLARRRDGFLVAPAELQRPDAVFAQQQGIFPGWRAAHEKNARRQQGDERLPSARVPATGHSALMTPQAMRGPAPPIGWVIWSSRLTWMTKAAPSSSSMAGRPSAPPMEA